MTTDNDAQPTRPQRSKIVKIVDCEWVKVFDNPAPRCPHGLRWRESDYEEMPPEVREQMCNERACQAVEFHPHRGESVDIRVYRAVGDRQALSELGMMLIGDEGALVSMGIKGDAIQRKMGEVLAAHIEAWTWTGIDGEPLPLPSKDWSAVWAQLEMSELMGLVNAVQVGGVPTDALRAIKNG